MSDAEARQLFPAFLDLSGRLCVVIGDGERAERKARALVAAGGDVAVVSSDPTDSLLESGTAGELTVEQRGYVRGDLAGAAVVVCVGQPEEISRAVAAEASEQRCLVNVSGYPELCNFLMPSSLARGRLEVAVSTGGAAPEAARLARARLAETLGEEWAAFTALVSDARRLAAERRLSADERAGLLERASDPSILERLAQGEEITAEGLLGAETDGSVEDAEAESGSAAEAGAGEQTPPDTGDEPAAGRKSRKRTRR